MDYKGLREFIDSEIKKTDELLEYYSKIKDDRGENDMFHLDYICKNILNLSDQEIIEFKNKLN